MSEEYKEFLKEKEIIEKYLEKGLKIEKIYGYKVDTCLILSCLTCVVKHFFICIKLSYIKEIGM